MGAGRRLLSALPYLIVLAAAAFLYGVAARIDFVGRAGQIGPDFWPRAVLALLALACLYEIVKRLVFARTGSVDGMLQSLMSAPGGDDGESPAGRPGGVRLFAGVAATLAYVGLVGWLGFFATTWAFLSAFMLIGGYRRWGVALVSGGVGGLVLVFLFVKVVYVSLPLGVGPFRALSLALLAALGVR